MSMERSVLHMARSQSSFFGAVYAPSLKAGSNQRRGAMNSQPTPRESRRARSSWASSSICATDFEAISGTASSSWNWMAENPISAKRATFSRMASGWRVGGP